MRTKGVPIGSPDLNGSPAEETRHKNEAESKNRNTQWMIRLTLKKEKEKRKTRGDLVLTLDVKIDHRPSTPEWNFEIKKEPNREYLTGGSLIWFRSGLGSSHLVVIEMRNQRRRRSAAAPPKVTEQQKKMICEEKKKRNKIGSRHPVFRSRLFDWPARRTLTSSSFRTERKKNEWKKFRMEIVLFAGGGWWWWWWEETTVRSWELLNHDLFCSCCSITFFFLLLLFGVRVFFFMETVPTFSVRKRERSCAVIKLGKRPTDATQTTTCAPFIRIETCSSIEPNDNR